MISGDLGVASAIVGVREYRLGCVGERRDARSTLMAERRDASLEVTRTLTLSLAPALALTATATRTRPQP